MKRLIAILLLGLFAYQLIGGYLVFKIWQWQIKSNIKHQILHSLPPEKITLLSLDSTQQKQMQWEEEGEFVYQGRWYDVIKIIPQAQFTLYYCYHDTKEEKLLKKFSHLIDNQWFNEKSPIQKTKQIFKKILEEPLCLFLWNYDLSTNPSKKSYFDVNSQLFDNQIVKYYPPPESYLFISC